MDICFLVKLAVPVLQRAAIYCSFLFLLLWTGTGASAGCPKSGDVPGEVIFPIHFFIRFNQDFI